MITLIILLIILKIIFTNYNKYINEIEESKKWQGILNIMTLLMY